MPAKDCWEQARQRVEQEFKELRERIARHRTEAERLRADRDEANAPPEVPSDNA